MSRYEDDQKDPSYLIRIGPLLLELAREEVARTSPSTIRMTSKERHALMGTAFHGHIGYEQNGEGFSMVHGIPIVLDESDSLFSRGQRATE